MGLQKEPSAYERQLVALGRVLQTLREEKSVDVLLETTLVYLQAEFNYVLCWIGLYDQVEHCLFGRGGTTPGGEVAFLKQQFRLNPGDLMEQVVVQQRLVGVPDLREELRAGEWRQAAKKWGVQGAIIFPIRHKDCCFGVTMLGSNLWGVSPHAQEKARLSMVLGSLGAALDQVKVEQQRQKTKRPDEPLLTLLAKLRSLPSLAKRLEAIVDETHQFIGASRTNIYWFDPQSRYFWRRIGSRKNSLTANNEAMAGINAGINVQEVNSFYQLLLADQTVSIGEAQSSLKADMTGRLMQQMEAQSLLAAPILLQNELLGFLAVEGTEPRIWLDEEKNYIRGVSQLIALTAPLEQMEETVQRVKQDQMLTAEISHAIYSDDDWKATLKKCAQQLCQRLQSERFLVLLYDKEIERFEVCFQSQPTSRRPLGSHLEGLNQVDWQMLERSVEAVGVENLVEDLKLMAWREVFLDLGVQSLLVCNTAIGNPLEGVVVIGHENTRIWSQGERDIVQIVSQQIGLILHQWQLQRQTDQQHKLYQMVQWGLTSMQHTHQIDQLEQSAMQHISQVLQVPLTTLVTWQPGRKAARIVAPVVTNNKFSLAIDSVIPVYTDTLVQWALQTDDLLNLSVDDLTPETRQWLSGTEIGRVLVMTLRTAPEHEPTGIVILADRRDRQWTERQMSVLGTLVSQLAWSRRYLNLTDDLNAQRESLKRLNWYKHHRLEEIYRTLNLGVRRLSELSHQKEALAGMRFQQILRHFGSILTTVAPVLRQEHWQLQNAPETAPLVSLLKRSMERVEGLIKQRQLWSQVHNESNVAIAGDISKIELVLYELLTTACYRSPPNSRLDIWCRELDARWLEISITDNGVIEPRLLEELQSGQAVDLLAPSTLDQPPGLHLTICQSLMRQLGGEFNLYKLDDGRILSRLILSIATHTPAALAQVTRLQEEDTKINS
jgi:GAF domain-containing protein